MSQVQIQKAPSVASSLHSFRQRRYSEVSGRSGLTTLSEDTLSTTGEEAQDDDAEEKFDDFFQHNIGWKFFLYLPFDPVWEVFVIFLIITDLIGLTIVDADPEAVQEENEDVFVMDLTVGVVVLIDNLLMICAKVIANVHISYEHMKRPIWIILFNIISAIPDVATKPLFDMADNTAMYFLRLKDLLIIFHVINYTQYRLKSIRKERVVIAFYNYFLTTFCLFVVLNYLYFLERCIIRDRKCTSDDRVINYINAAATIVYRRLGEKASLEIILWSQLIFSYLTYFCVFVPMAVEVIMALVNKNRHKYAFNRKKRIAENALNNSNAHYCVKMRIAEFFNYHWEKNVGYSDMELKPFLQTLAPTVYDELRVDMNFKALKHSKLFQHMDLPFLRCVALAMEQTFALPGEVLYQKSHNKHTMVYVVSGIIQVLSDQDGDTAILSLSAGTCLGETSLIVNYNSTSSVVCKEYCVLQTLGMKGFVNVGRKFPKQLQRLRRLVSNRYGMAKKLKALEDQVDTAQEEATADNKKMRIMWLNSMLHRLMTKDETTLSQHMCQNIYLREDFDSSAYETVTSTATYLDLLAVAERTELVSDSVFHNIDSFPPILQPYSVLLNIWNIFLCIPAIAVCFATPAYAFMYPFIPKWYWWLANVSTLLYVFDIYLTATTAVKIQHLVLDSCKDIFSYRLGTLVFWLDIIAAYPLQLHANSFLLEVSDMSYALLYLNRCFKFAKTVKVFKYFAKKCKWCRKSKIFNDYMYINLILSYLIIFFGMFANAMVCKYLDIQIFCYAHGKLSFANILMFYITIIGEFFYMLSSAVTFDLLDALTTSYIAISVIAGTILLFAITVITSKGVMSCYNQTQLNNMILNLRDVANCLRVKANCRNRVGLYIYTQWDYNFGESLFSSSDVFAEMPVATYKLLKENSYQDFVKNMPLFKELNDAMIIELCTLANVLILPPKELIAYKGEPVTVIYYLIDGFVELVSGKNTKHTVRPGESLSVFEAYLNLPLLNTSVTCTYCRLLTLPWNLVKALISPFDDMLSADFRDLKEQFAQIKQSKWDIIYDFNVDTGRSFKKFGYNLKLDSEEEYEYYVPFDRLRMFSFVQFMLLRVTFLPNGNFVFLWEISRSIFATVSAILYTVPPVLTCRNCYWWWVLLFLDLTAVVDIYVKLHFCYYNDKGLLITHPLKTASHYIKHSLLIDVLAVFPFRFFFNVTSSYKSRVNAIIHYMRCFQLYRTYYFLKGTALVPVIVRKLLEYVAILFITTFLLSSVVVNVFCEFYEDIPESMTYTEGVKCLENSWFYHTNNAFARQLNPWDVYTSSVIIVAMCLANMDFGLFWAGLKVFNVIVRHILMVSGYCLFIILVNKMSVLLTNRADLFEYQRAMYLLKRYMKRQKVAVTTQREIIQHYELQWKKNRNNSVYRLTVNLHKTLRADTIYEIYGKVLERNSVFREVNRHFYKSLLIACKHEAYCSGFTICSVNDIMSMVYILYNGCVEVKAPDGTILTSLGVGSMFGNLEEYPRVRQTVGFVTSENAEVLIVPTEDYFKCLKLHPKLYKAFKYLTAVHIDFLKGPLEDDVDLELQNMKYARNRMVFNREMICYKIWRFILLLPVCYILNMFHLYLITVNECNLYMYILLYIGDVLYTIDVLCVRYLTAYTDETGSLVTNLQLIRNRQNKNKAALIISLLATVPVDVPVWFIPMSGYLRCKLLLYLRINRQLRLYEFFMYLQAKRNELNSSNTLLRCIILICFIAIITQILCCVYIKLSCLERFKDVVVAGQKFSCDILSNDSQGLWYEHLFNYSIALYVIASFILTAGQYYQIYVDIYLSFSMSMIALVTTILATYTFAEVCSIMRSNLFWRMVYESHCRHLLNFMKRRDVSQQMTKKIWNYVVFFWKRQNGVSLPKLLIEAPSPLKLKVMGSCYLHHITKSMVFKKCHEDFVRQLVLLLRVDTYFYGDYIAFKGDINDCMYFIHTGSVLIMSEDTCRKEDVIGKLVVGQSFGVPQGLYPSTAHVHFYIAASNCDILSLNRKAWMYLLDYFPASKEVIYNAAESYFGF